MKVKVFLEFTLWGSLVLTNAARSDICLEVVFARDGRAVESAQHGDLADVSEGVGDGALEELFRGGVERLAGVEIVVKITESLEEAIYFLSPGQRLGIVPGLFALGQT